MKSQVKALGTVNIIDPRRLLCEQVFVYSSLPHWMIPANKFKVSVISPITVLKEFIAGQMVVCWFVGFFKQAPLYTLGKNLTQFSSMIPAVIATKKASCAFIQTKCVHQNLVLILVFIKSLTSDFVSLFLLRIS